MTRTSPTSLVDRRRPRHPARRRPSPTRAAYSRCCTPHEVRYGMYLTLTTDSDRAAHTHTRARPRPGPSRTLSQHERRPTLACARTRTRRTSQGLHASPPGCDVRPGVGRESSTRALTTTPRFATARARVQLEPAAEKRQTVSASVRSDTDDDTYSPRLSSSHQRTAARATSNQHRNATRSSSVGSPAYMRSPSPGRPCYAADRLRGTDVGELHCGWVGSDERVLTGRLAGPPAHPLSSTVHPARRSTFSRCDSRPDGRRTTRRRRARRRRRTPVVVRCECQ